MIEDCQGEIDKIRSELIEKYNQLPALEKKIVQLFSVIYEPVNRTAFLGCLNYIGIRDENDKTFVSSSLKPYIDSLLAKGLLVQELRQGPQCNPLIVEIVTRSAVKAGHFAAMAKAVEDKLPVSTRYRNGTRDFQRQSQLLCQVRMGIYNQDIDFINKKIQDYEKYNYSSEKISFSDIVEQVCNNPFDSDWCRTLSQELYKSIITNILTNSVLRLSLADEAFNLLEEECSTAGKHSSDYSQMVLAEQQLLRGNLEKTQQCLERISDKCKENAAVFWGWLHFLKGENDKAIEYYSRALKYLKKAKGKNKVYFNTIGGLFFILALLKDGSVNRLKEAQEYANLIARQSEHWLKSTYTQLKILLQIQQGDIQQISSK